MAVRQNNRRGPRATAEAGLGCLEYLVRASGQSSIHQHPFAPGSADEIHVGETDRQPADIRRDARDRVCHGYVDLRQSTRPDQGMISVWPTRNSFGLSMLFLFASRISFHRFGE